VKGRARFNGKSDARVDPGEGGGRTDRGLLVPNWAPGATRFGGSSCHEGPLTDWADEDAALPGKTLACGFVSRALAKRPSHPCPSLAAGRGDKLSASRGRHLAFNDQQGAAFAENLRVVHPRLCYEFAVMASGVSGVDASDIAASISRREAR
jgi:hypothetical protein